MRIDTLHSMISTIVMATITAYTCLVVNRSQAQYVYIPDPDMRTWLNSNIPGVVDAAGYMDTTHVGIAGFTNASINAGSIFGPTDLTGIQYLDGLTGLEIHVFDPGVIIPAFPAALEYLLIYAFGGTSLPPLPSGLVQLSLSNASDLAGLPPLPAGLQYLELDAMAMLSALPSLPADLIFLWLYDVPLLSSIPALPAALDELMIKGAAIVTMPMLPSSITRITLWGLSSLTQLPLWPASLSWIQLLQLPVIDVVPTLPSGLDHLALGGIPALPAWPPIPPDLEQLNVGNFPFTALPPLPTGLKGLDVSFMSGMVLMPQLPLGLTNLSVTYMPGLLALPLLPGGLMELRLEDLQGLAAMPELPASLISFYMVDCDGVPCLPPLPPGLADLTVYSAVIDCLPGPLAPWVFADLSFDQSTICSDPCTAAVPLLGGRVFHDENANGIWDGSEDPLPGAVVTVAPGSLFASSSASGQYLMALPIGSYLLSAASPVPYPQSTLPVLQSSTLTLPTDVDTTIHFGVSFEAGHHDLGAHITATPARPGFQNVVWITITNHGTEPTSGEVTLEFDPDQNWLSSSMPPTSSVGQQAIWDIPVLVVGSSWTSEIVLATPVGIPIGTGLLHDLAVVADGVDEGPGNDQAVFTEVVVGSYDPNDKRVDPEELALAELVAGEPVQYTIRFQNTGTAPAAFVEIIDTLSPSLQWATMRFEAGSHPCTWEVRSGILRLRFDPIVLPDSITYEPGSHGYVRFSMVPVQSLTPGAQVENRACIYFDFNPPVTTMPAVFTIELTTAVAELREKEIMIHPVPAHDVLWVAAPMEFGVGWMLDVIDMGGRTLRTIIAESDPIPVVVQDLQAGAYVIQLRSPSQVFRARFIKD